MFLINKTLLDSVSAQAKENPRLRMNFNFHERAESPSQRMLNALECGTVVPVHRHRKAAETYVVLRGRIRVLYYNDARELMNSAILEPADENVGVNIPIGQWHSLEVLEPGSIIFEAKDGPYAPFTDDDILP